MAYTKEQRLINSMSGSTKAERNIPITGKDQEGFVLPNSSKVMRGDNKIKTERSYTSGSVLFAGEKVIEEDNSNLYWDNTNKRLGVGTNSPFTNFEIVGDSADMVIRQSDGKYSIGLQSFSGGQGVLNLFDDASNSSRTSAAISFTAQGNNHSWINNTNGRLGVGTNSPTERLDINDDAIRIRTSQTPTTSVGASGDNQGIIAWDSSYIYICTADYDGSSNIWKRVAIGGTW